MTHQTHFEAVLVYQQGENRFVMEPFRCHAAHPEIAYQLALRRGDVGRYGLQLVGFASLEATLESDDPLISVSKGGDARAHVVPKHELGAFRDPRWADVECSQSDIDAALAEPEPLVDLADLDDVNWAELTHAYGPATDVPIDLRRLAGPDEELREGAWQLSGSIYHQGTLYPATAPAIPFLMRIAYSEAVPDRSSVLELLLDIAASSTIPADHIRRLWHQRESSFPGFHDAPPDEMADREIEDNRAVADALRACREQLHELAADADSEIAEPASGILEMLDDPGGSD